MHNVTIYFTDGKKKTIEHVIFYKYGEGSIKLNLPDHTSIIFPFVNVKFIEIETFTKGEVEEELEEQNK